MADRETTVAYLNFIIPCVLINLPRTLFPNYHSLPQFCGTGRPDPSGARFML